MLVHLRDGSTQKIIHAATLRQNLQIKPSISPSHSTQKQVQPIPALTLQRRIWSTSFEVTDVTRPGKRSTVKVGIESRSAVLEADALPLGLQSGYLNGYLIVVI